MCELKHKPMISRCHCGSLVVFLFWLCSAFPLSILPHLLLPCVYVCGCGRSSSSSRVAHLNQMIPLAQIHLLGLCTTSEPIIVSHMVTIQTRSSVFLILRIFCVCVSAPALMPTSLLAHLQKSPAPFCLASCSPEFLNAGPTQPSLPACLLARLPATPVIPSTLPSSIIC